MPNWRGWSAPYPEPRCDGMQVEVATPIFPGQTVTVSYSGRSLRRQDGERVEFTDLAVTNGSTASKPRLKVRRTGSGSVAEGAAVTYVIEVEAGGNNLWGPRPGPVPNYRTYGIPVIVKFVWSDDSTGSPSEAEYYLTGKNTDGPGSAQWSFDESIPDNGSHCDDPLTVRLFPHEGDWYTISATSGATGGITIVDGGDPHSCGTGQAGAALPAVSLTARAESAVEGAAGDLPVNLAVSETGAMLGAYVTRTVIPDGSSSKTFEFLTLNDETDEADSVVTAVIAEDGERYVVGEPSSASVTVLDDDRRPLTAEFREAPAAHDGENAFTLRIAFSEAVATSYRTLRDHALDVTGGAVTGAKRVDGRSDLWRITIEPDSDAGVTVVLPVTDSCDAEGAICTGDGGMLSNRLEMTIPGPVAEEQQQAEPEAENSPATGAPSVTGTARVGETLTADTSGIADADGLADAEFSYQWLADDADIEGATNSTYTLADADEGKAIRVRVSFSDDAGNEETLTSAVTPPAPTNLTATVNGDGSVTLTWDAPDDDSVTGYQVLRRRPYEGEKTLLVYVENTGSTATTFTDADVTAGTQHVYRVKAINDAGVGAQSNYVNVDP